MKVLIQLYGMKKVTSLKYYNLPEGWIILHVVNHTSFYLTVICSQEELKSTRQVTMKINEVGDILVPEVNRQIWRRRSRVYMLVYELCPIWGLTVTSNCDFTSCWIRGVLDQSEWMLIYHPVKYRRALHFKESPLGLTGCYFWTPASMKVMADDVFAQTEGCGSHLPSLSLDVH